MVTLKPSKVKLILKDLIKCQIKVVAAKHNVSEHTVAHIAKGNSYSDITGFTAGTYTLSDMRLAVAKEKEAAKIARKAERLAKKTAAVKHVSKVISKTVSKTKKR